MTVTTKVETRTYADLSTWGKRFSKRAMKEMAGYLANSNMATAAVTYLDDGDDNDLANTAVQPCVLNGILIPVLPSLDCVIATQDIGDGSDLEVADGYEMNYLITASAAGLMATWQAGVQAVTGASVVKLPQFDTSTQVALALLLWDNDDASAAANLGDAAADLNTDGTFYQLIGSVLPHPDNFLN